MLFAMCCCTREKIDQTVIPVNTKVDITIDGLAVTSILLRPFLVMSTSLDIRLHDQLSNFGLPIEDQELSEKLLLEGIHVVLIDTVDVPAIVASMGEIINEEFVWHGQIHAWRDIRQRVIPRGGMLITAEGIPYLVEGGYLSILARSWLVNREDGDFVYLQTLPTWHMPSARSGLFGKSENVVQKKIFSDLNLEAMLVDSQALLIAVELAPTSSSTGPFDGGKPAVRLGEALMGGPVTERVIAILVLEANLQSH
ncbi:MAG: hypothetical protein VX436_01770 [Planctomycetota bacterium]|nr:hypothetical protein [Planctomycetota bacterium]